MDFGTIAGAGGVATLAGIIVEVARRTGLPARITPLASIIVGAASAEVYAYIGWLGVPSSAFALSPVQTAVGAAVIGIVAGYGVDRVTDSIVSAQPKTAEPPKI